MDRDAPNTWPIDGGWRAADHIKWMIPMCINTWKRN
jgi:hypothetical protein